MKDLRLLKEIIEFFDDILINHIFQIWFKLVLKID